MKTTKKAHCALLRVLINQKDLQLCASITTQKNRIIRSAMIYVEDVQSSKGIFLSKKGVAVS